mgnify:CR=1 FL=1
MTKKMINYVTKIYTNTISKCRIAFEDHDDYYYSDGIQIVRLKEPVPDSE